ncbi:imidazoleglycerol-phosphate dehydratase HisB [Helicobacter aurati]|uniref:Imidazoleglycerol-phosphate dehydratase n=1 Tax=Helicobacter aurati TaxID=137778 RepID=A0A3D8J7S9_9HELI|nr:imidazoleglycerol-phosphate dehydratase HisB [Helicobacter aurati]RDU73472.1 imidazoleglycerol-phosphate dehydratase HisB [Helicobacter aurati]
MEKDYDVKRFAEIARKTKETDIHIQLSLYGSGRSTIDTGIGFFNHMLESFSKHALIDMNIQCTGDIFVDFHHTVEDCGIVIGQALQKCMFPVGNIERFGNGSVVMDEACVECDLDVSNRAFLFFDMSNAQNGYKGKIGNFDVELVEEFFRAVVMNAGISTHIALKRGKNLHHITESIFKAFALSLRRANTYNQRVCIPSTKGCL